MGDLAAVMREAVLWTSRGRNVTEDDLTAMLEGREDLSEVQENPFAEMMKEDEAAEGAAPAEGTAPATENAPLADTTAPVEASAVVDPEKSNSSVEMEMPDQVGQDNEDVEEAPVEPEKSSSSVEMEIPGQAGNDNEDIPAEEIPTEEPQPSDNMTDEEFEAFMKKAQAFYDTQANENSDSDDDDEFPNIEIHSGD